MFGTTLAPATQAEIQKLMAEIARAPRNVRYVDMPDGSTVRMSRGDRKRMARQRANDRILGERDGSVLISLRYVNSAARQQRALNKLAETGSKPKRARKPAAAKVV